MAKKPKKPKDRGPRADEDGPLEDTMCGARRKRSNKLCRAPAMANGRCRVHGGATPRGAMNASFKHGRTSTAFIDSLPENLRERFSQAMSDPDLLSIRKYVALYETRVMTALDRLKALDPGAYRNDLRVKWADFRRENAVTATTDEERQAKAAAVGSALQAIEAAIEKGGEVEAAWQEVDAAIKNRMVATESEHRRLIDMQQMLTIEQGMGLVIVLNSILANRLKDKSLLSLIGRDIEQQLGLELAGGDKADVVDAVSVEPVESLPAAEGGKDVDVARIGRPWRRNCL